MVKRKPATIDEYLAGVTAEKRPALGKLRKDIQAAAPHAEECISYGILGFRLNGKYLVGFGTTRKDCSFYPGSVVQRFEKELTKYNLSKGTIRFSPQKRYPAH